MLETLYQQVIDGIYSGKGDVETEAFVQGKEQLSAEEQLGIYRGSVRGHLSSALADIFPAVQAALGETFFEALALRYVDQHPSRSPRLDDYGESFPDFAGAFEPLADYPYIADLARLDWHWHRVFHMQNPTVARFDTLAELASEQIEVMQMTLIEPLVWIESDYPLEKIWRLSRYPNEAQESEAVDLKEGKSTVVVYRSGLDVLVTSIEPLCLDVLRAIKKRDSFGTICQNLRSKGDPERIHQALGFLVQHQWISECIVEPEPSRRA